MHYSREDPGREAVGAATPALGPRPLIGRWTATEVVSLVVAAACAFFVFAQMRPDLMFADTTPSGGDMGAHVWGPAFLRDHLLTEGRLTGWTPDWYAGFPAYRFYMVVPSLLIVAVNAGFRPVFAVPVVLALVGGGWYGIDRLADRVPFVRENKGSIRLAIICVSLLFFSVPYGIAFKVVSLSGLISFPLAAWAMGRLARAPEPIPPLLAVSSLFFLFDTNFSIYGGNIASTLAGEFAFSMSLSLTLLAFGLAARGMTSGRVRVAAAIVISLIALTHIIPVFFAIVGLIALIGVDRKAPRLWPVAVAIALSLIPIAFADGTSMSVAALAVGAAVVVLVAFMVSEERVFSRAIWLAVVGPVAALLSGFWLVPFYLREPFFNDMGWPRLDEVGAPLLTIPMGIALPIAAVGAVAAIALRDQIGIMFATTALVFAAAVANLGDGPLWNARLLPFYYLSVYFLAAIGAGIVVRFVASAVSESLELPDPRVILTASVVALIGGLVAVGMPLRILPGGHTNEEGIYTWMNLTSHAKSFIPSWTAWNYSGYEEKAAYREYRSVVLEMDEVGQSTGCGRAMWEYDKSLDRYGTPMALMLLPHWTDGCIGSMEGLYFESSATTPFHFLNQSMLSQNPSRAQRDLPYQDFDIGRGISQLQVMGVRYYMASEDDSIFAARAHPELTEVGEAQPFVIFEVAGSELVEGLSYEPVVVNGQSTVDAGVVATRFDVGWLGQAVTFYNDPGGYQALPAESGPGDWDQVQTLLPSDGEPIDPAIVTNLEIETSSIRFNVDEVGKPVLVKVSYFPNWDVDGADGPYRVGPNLMAVVPTSTEVELHYGRSLVELLGGAATVLGLAGLGALFIGDRRRLASGVVPARRKLDLWRFFDPDGDRFVDGGAEGDDFGHWESDTVLDPAPDSHPAPDSEPAPDWVQAPDPGPLPATDPSPSSDPVPDTEPVGGASIGDDEIDASNGDSVSGDYGDDDDDDRAGGDGVEDSGGKADNGATVEDPVKAASPVVEDALGAPGGADERVTVESATDEAARQGR